MQRERFHKNSSPLQFLSFLNATRGLETRERRRKTARHLLTGAWQSYFFLMQNLTACSRGIKSSRAAGSAEGLERLTRLA